MDKLEQFIRDNREHLDRYEPDPAIWSKVVTIEPAKAGIRIRDIVLRAAMLIFIVASSWFIYSVTSGGSANGSGRISSSARRASPELTETENYYNTRVNNLLREARPYLTSNPGLESELMSEISQLDSLMAGIRNDLKDNISNQEVIEALIMNYRIKVQLLEEVLIILRDPEKVNNDNKEHYEL